MPKPDSPKKKSSSPRKKATPIAKDKGLAVQGMNGPFLTVYATHEDLNIELLTYTQNEANDCYTTPLKNFCDGTLEYSGLDALNLGDYGYRKVPGSDNVIMKNTKKGNYWRMVFYRHTSLPSTPESRAEFMEKVRTFFMDATISDYPPSQIVCQDMTRANERHALDEFLLDSDIVRIVKITFEEGDLNGSFFNKYPDLAGKIWSGIHYPDFARTLGFP